MKSLLQCMFWAQFYYNQAKHKVIVDDKSIEETINDIVVLLANKRSCYCFPQNYLYVL
jgi:hypothetical protein